MKKLILLLPALALCGCAYMTSTTTRVTDPKTGIVTEETKAIAYAMFDSKSSMLKFRNQSGYSGGTNAGFSPGTYMAGVGQEATTTNLATIIQAVATGVVNGMK